MTARTVRARGAGVFVDPPMGAWTDAALPNVGKARLLSLIGCRVQVRDAEGVLVLTWDGAAWSLPAVGHVRICRRCKDD